MDGFQHSKHCSRQYSSCKTTSGMLTLHIDKNWVVMLIISMQHNLHGNRENKGRRETESGCISNKAEVRQDKYRLTKEGI